MKSPSASRLRPVDTFRKPVAEDGKGSRRCILDRVQSLLPGECQTSLTEEHRHQVVIGVQLHYLSKAASLFERPPKLSSEKVERQTFDGKITGKDHSSVCHRYDRVQFGCRS